MQKMKKFGMHVEVAQAKDFVSEFTKRLDSFT